VKRRRCALRAERQDCLAEKREEAHHVDSVQSVREYEPDVKLVFK
jgi:hypothetical protein